VQSDYDLAQLMHDLLLQDRFWSAQGAMIKAPIELVVGCIQLFNTDMPSQRRVLEISRTMGQELFNPPHVKGWPGGKAWYTTSNLSLREQAVDYFARQVSVIPNLSQLLATAPVGTLPSTDSSDYLSSVLSDPTFQVV
jgi:uncharacterized protein (DUF1800 family)